MHQVTLKYSREFCSDWECSGHEENTLVCSCGWQKRVNRGLDARVTAIEHVTGIGDLKEVQS